MRPQDLPNGVRISPRPGLRPDSRGTSTRRDASHDFARTHAAVLVCVAVPRGRATRNDPVAGYSVSHVAQCTAMHRVRDDILSLVEWTIWPVGLETGRWKCPSFPFRMVGGNLH